MRRWLVLVLALLLAACRLTLESNNTNTNTGGTGGSGPTSPTPPTPTPTPTPTPSPIPTPTPAPGSRTPDPPPGFVLPLPSYSAQVIGGVPFDVAQTCLSFAYLDAVVDRLRANDTRWGYACASSGCGVGVSLDKLAYHATPGPDVTGALGVWVVDIIVDVCGAARPGFSPSYEATTGWSSRGRF